MRVSRLREHDEPDGTRWVAVIGCEHCKRWTRTTLKLGEAARYPHRALGCEWGWEEMPVRAARIDPQHIEGDVEVWLGPKILEIRGAPPPIVTP